MRIGTRGSALALWQARTAARLIGETGGPACEIVVIRTSGDEAAGGPPDAPASAAFAAVDRVGSSEPPNVKRLFVKEIEEALLAGRIDLAVHSAKDLPASLPDGLGITAALEREDPRDVVILPAGSAACDLPAVKLTLGASPRIGTSSVRRAAQLRALFPGGVFTPVRGNVDTRLRKLDARECDALVLAAAGIKRLGLAARVAAWLPAQTCVPAPGQGIVAIEVADDCAGAVREAVARISDADAMTAFIAERAVVQSLGGGCQMPLGVLATLDGQDLVLEGVVASLDGRRVIRAVVHGNRGGAAAAGEKLAARLRELGAAALLDSAASPPR